MKNKNVTVIYGINVFYELYKIYWSMMMVVTEQGKEVGTEEFEKF